MNDQIIIQELANAIRDGLRDGIQGMHLLRMGETMVVEKAVPQACWNCENWHKHDRRPSPTRQIGRCGKIADELGISVNCPTVATAADFNCSLWTATLPPVERPPTDSPKENE